MSEIKENYGGFIIHSVGLRAPRITRLAPLKYSVNMRLNTIESTFKYAVEVYVNGEYVLTTQESVINIQSPTFMEAYWDRQKIIVTFYVVKLTDAKKKSPATELVEHYVIASDKLLCSQTTICSNQEVENV